MVRYKKSLGQHILQNSGAARRIVESLELADGDCVLEIGPGRGALTNTIARMSVRLVAVEVDDDMVVELRNRFADLDNVEIIHSNFLAFDSGILDNRARWKVVGNLPYNITAPILERLFASYKWFQLGVFTVQKEFADRMVADAGDSEYSSISVFVKTYSDAERLFVLRPGSFFPPPKVSSAVVRLRFRDSAAISDSELEAFSSFVQNIFSHRRKTIANCLSLATDNSKEDILRILSTNRIDPGARPQDLDLNDYTTVFRNFSGLADAQP